jgi:hypothetical protein
MIWIQDGTIGMDIKLTGILSTSLLFNAFRKTKAATHSHCVQLIQTACRILITSLSPSLLLKKKNGCDDMNCRTTPSAWTWTSSRQAWG